MNLDSTNKSSFYSPIICLSISTEINANEQGRYLYSDHYSERQYSFKPSSVPQKGLSFFPYMNKNLLYSYYYISTPLISSLEIGNEFKIVKGLYLNLGLGLSVRYLKVGYKEWHKSQSEPESDFNITTSFRNTDKVLLFDMRLGLSYTLLSKKELSK